jgi:hypothetical protein
MFAVDMEKGAFFFLVWGVKFLNTSLLGGIRDCRNNHLNRSRKYILHLRVFNVRTEKSFDLIINLEYDTRT